jgi:DNA-binding transcriptional MerR regulator
MEWSIKQTTKKLGVSSRALRYYEVRGMLKPKRFGGIRYYDEVQRDRILEILRGKQLGFSLTEIQDLIDRPNAGEGKVEDETYLDTQIQFLTQKKREIEDALSQLGQLRSHSDPGSPHPLAGLTRNSGFDPKRSSTLSNLHRAQEFTRKRVEG